jgi:thiosulfate/3-mercaptopyruvate sulfurtransferase
MPPATDSSFGPLVSVGGLATLLESDREAPAMLDVRWQLGGPAGRPKYLNGHIPGAVFVDLETELSAPRRRGGTGGRHPLPDADAFTRSMRASGVFVGRGVIAYDAAGGLAAARAWWLLRYFGHAQVAVLDGGFAAWVRAGHPVQRDVPRVDPGDFTARPGGMALIDAEDAAALPRRGGVLLDARASERFSGESEPVDPVAGHIPGALNLPATALLDDSGRFRSPAELRTAFAAAGAGDGVPVGAYCGSGVTAAQEVLALELAGLQAALYAGSWSDWISDPTRPVARGA